jgi:uncharacterized protein (DUF2062 family)
MGGIQILKFPKFPNYKQVINDFVKSGLSTEQIAFGIALGNFVGILPFIGLHTVMAIGCAHLFRLNTLVVVLGSNISNPLSFPFILIMSAQIGSLILNGGLLPLDFNSDLNVVKTYVLPTLIGSLLLGIVVSIASYFVVLRIVKRFRA